MSGEHPPSPAERARKLRTSTAEPCEHAALFSPALNEGPFRPIDCQFCVAHEIEEAVRAERERYMLTGHECQKVASLIMEEGRDWWFGRLTKPIQGFPQEKWCLHIQTPLKSVVLGLNYGDVTQLAAGIRLLAGHIDKRWLEHMAGTLHRRAGSPPTGAPLCRCPPDECGLHPSLTTCGMRGDTPASALPPLPSQSEAAALRSPAPPATTTEYPPRSGWKKPERSTAFHVSCLYGAGVEESAKRMAERMTGGVYDRPSLETRAEFLEALTEELAHELARREREVREECARIANDSAFVDGPEGTVEGQIARAIIRAAPPAPAPETPSATTERSELDADAVEDYIRGLSWSEKATDLERTLVAGNIRAFAAHVRGSAARRFLRDVFETPALGCGKAPVGITCASASGGAGERGREGK